MKNFIISKTEYPFLLALAFYTLAGVIALCLFTGRREPPAPAVSAALEEEPDTLYDIRPQLTETPKAEPEPEPIVSEPEPAPEPESEPADTQPEHYYAFTTVTPVRKLHVRTAPSLDAKIIARLPKGTTGFILEPGEKWSKVQTPDVTGYCYNKYLEIREIPKEEYLIWPEP